MKQQRRRQQVEDKIDYKSKIVRLIGWGRVYNHEFDLAAKR